MVCFIFTFFLNNVLRPVRRKLILKKKCCAWHDNFSVCLKEIFAYVLYMLEKGTHKLLLSNIFRLFNAMAIATIVSLENGMYRCKNSTLTFQHKKSFVIVSVPYIHSAVQKKSTSKLQITFERGEYVAQPFGYREEGSMPRFS